MEAAYLTDWGLLEWVLVVGLLAAAPLLLTGWLSRTDPAPWLDDESSSWVWGVTIVVGLAVVIGYLVLTMQAPGKLFRHIATDQGVAWSAVVLIALGLAQAVLGLILRFLADDDYLGVGRRTSTWVAAVPGLLLAVGTIGGWVSDALHRKAAAMGMSFDDFSRLAGLFGLICVVVCISQLVSRR